MKNEEENEEQQERKKMWCKNGIGLKSNYFIYNPARFQNEKINIFGGNEMTHLSHQFNLLVFRNTEIEAST